MSNFQSLYLKNLRLKNVRSFKGDYHIDLSDGHDKPAQWSIILGNNNTGKTTLLRAIADLEPKLLGKGSFTDSFNTDRTSVPHYQIKIGSGKPRSVVDVDKEISIVGCDFLIRQDFSSRIKFSTYKLFNIVPEPDKRGINEEITRFRWCFTAGSLVSGFCYSKNDIDLESVKFFGYGPSRRITPINFQNELSEDNTIGLFLDIELMDVEAWLLQTDYAQKNHNEKAKKILSKIKLILFESSLLPGLTNLNFITDNQLKSFVMIQTTAGWVKLRDLSYGYQSMIAWLIDLAKRLFDRYPDMENPLHGPAIVLVDEIDLHMHPDWQRKIIKYLSDLFPNTQFIVTAHSPLIVQSAENVNLIMLEKDEKGNINVRQQFGSFQGWTVEEILRELMDMGEKTRSDRFLSLLKEFETGLLDEDYDKAKAAYDELDKILHPASSQRKLLSIQLSSLVPA